MTKLILWIGGTKTSPPCGKAEVACLKGPPISRPGREYGYPGLRTTLPRHTEKGMLDLPPLFCNRPTANLKFHQKPWNFLIPGLLAGLSPSRKPLQHPGISGGEMPLPNLCGSDFLIWNALLSLNYFSKNLDSSISFLLPFAICPPPPWMYPRGKLLKLVS